MYRLFSGNIKTNKLGTLLIFTVRMNFIIILRPPPPFFFWREGGANKGNWRGGGRGGTVIGREREGMRPTPPPSSEELVSSEQGSLRLVLTNLFVSKQVPKGLEIGGALLLKLSNKHRGPPATCLAFNITRTSNPDINSAILYLWAIEVFYFKFNNK